MAMYLQETFLQEVLVSLQDKSNRAVNGKSFCVCAEKDQAFSFFS